MPAISQAQNGAWSDWSRSQTRRLLAATRRRGALRAAARAIPASLWLASALLLAAALDHLWLGLGAERTLTLSAPCGALLALALAGWRGRPSWENAARLADRWYGGRSLLTSALDQWRREPERRAGAAPVVLACAESSAAGWRRASPPHGQRPPARRWWPQATLLAVATFSLLLPAAPRREPSAASGAVSSGPRAGTEDAGLDAWTMAAALDAGRASAGAPAPDAGQEDAGWTAAASPRARSSGGGEGRPEHAFALVAASSAPQAGGGGREAGDALGVSDRVQRAPGPDLEVRPVPLPGGPEASAFRSGGVPLSPQAAFPAPAVRASARASDAYAAPVARAPAVDPVVRGYAAAYMQRIRDVE